MIVFRKLIIMGSGEPSIDVRAKDKTVCLRWTVEKRRGCGLRMIKLIPKKPVFEWAHGDVTRMDGGFHVNAN